MFEKILEKILQSYFGRFITGFDQNNLQLGVLSGNVVIENVQLKPNIIESLDLPVKIKFSSVGKLILKVPWNKLSSAPVEVTLEDILIVFNPIQNAQFDIEQDILVKFNKILNSIKKALEKRKDNDEQRGYFSKLTLKILDNLQLSIKRIHLRYEDTTFSWGIKLDELDVITTNKEFLKCFVDRSDPKNKDAPSNKSIKLNSFQLYWNSKEVLFLTEYTPPEQLILDEIIKISAQARLSMNSKSQFDKPQFIIITDIDRININVQHSQIKQMVQILEYFSGFKKSVIKNRKQYYKNQDLNNQQEFIDHVIKLNKLQIKDLTNYENQEQLKKILQTTQQVHLTDWTKIAIKQIVLDQKVLELQKQKSKKGWFGWGSSEGEVQEQEVQQLKEFIDQSFDKDADLIVRPQLSVLLQIQLKLSGAQITLYNDFNSVKDEGVRLELSKIYIDNFLNQNKDFGFSLYIQGFLFQMMSFQKFENICYPTFETREIIKIEVTQSTNEQRKLLKILFHIQSLTAEYNPYIVKIFREIFRVKQGEKLDNHLKSTTWNKIEQIQDETQSKLQKLLKSTTQVNIDFLVNQPTLVLPFTNDQECWYLKLNYLTIKSISNTEDEYESFQISLNKGCFEYHPDRANSNILSVVKDYNASIQIGRLKDQSIQKPHLQVNAQFEAFNMILNEKVYKDMIYLPETIFPKRDQSEALKQLQQEKQQILKYQVKSGYLKKCGDLIRTWTPYYVILSGSDLIFYDTETSLMKDFTISIFNSSVSRLIVDDQLYAFKITNRYSDCIIACDNDEELDAWMQAITNQLEEFEMDQNKLKINKQQFELTKEIKVSLSRIEIKIYKDTKYPSKQNEHLLYLLKINNIKSLKTNNNLIQIDSLSIQDWVYDYANPQYQDLIVLSSKKEQSFKLQIGQDKKINIQLDTLVINWKPDVFLKLRSLFLIFKNRKSRRNYFSDIKDYEVDHLKRGSDVNYEEMKKSKLIEGLRAAALKCMRFGQSKVSIKEKFFSLVDYDNFLKDQEWVQDNILSQFPKAFKNNTQTLMELTASMKNTKVIFFHRTSHNTLAKAELEKINFTFRKLQFSNFIDCTAYDLNFSDMTNYPHTVDSNKEYKKIVPFKLIGKRDQYNLDILRFRFGGHDENILVSKDRTNLFLYAEVNPIFAIYQHQPIMRTIDYLINHIISLIKEPDSLTMNADFIQKKKHKDMKAKRAWGDVDFIQAKYICPTFIDLRIKLINPLIMLKGWMQFTEYFQIDAQEINVFNKQFIDKSRLKNLDGGMKLIETTESWMPDGTIKVAWSEKYCIEARKMQIQYFENITMGVSTPIDFNLSFERLLHCNEVCEIYNNVQYDRSLKIRSAMTPVVMKLYKKEYLEICKLIFHNFNYDDTKDRWFVHDYDVARSFNPAPISFFLDFQELALFALSKKSQQPLILIDIKNLRLEWKREEHIDLNLYGQFINMSHYEEMDQERGFMGDLTKSIRHQPQGKKYNLDFDYTFYQHLMPKEQNFSMYRFGDHFEKLTYQFKLLFHIIRPQGDKEIQINLNDVKMIVVPTVFANVGLWSKLEQQCWPPQNDFGEMPSIKMIIQIMNASLCLQGMKGNQILATQGNLSYIWNRARFTHPEKLIATYKKDHDKTNIEAIGEVFEHKVNLKQLELFKCIYQDYISMDLNQVHKRQIILPFSLFFCIKNDLNMDYSNYFVIIYINQIYYYNNFSFHIDKTTLKFSYQDLVLIMNIVDKLKSSKTDLIRESIYGEPEQPQFEAPINNIYDVVILGLQVVVINDAGEAYVPVFDLTLYETQLQYQQITLEKSKIDMLQEQEKQKNDKQQISTNKYVKSIISTVIKLSSTFYNPQIAIWEPLIEQCMFSLDISLNPYGDPQKLIFLEMTQQKSIFNINISSQMISVFHKTYLSWMKEIQNNKKVTDNDVVIDDKKESLILTRQQTMQNHVLIKSSVDEQINNIDYVSPYTIRNESGFVVYIEDDVKEKQDKQDKQEKQEKSEKQEKKQARESKLPRIGSSQDMFDDFKKSKYEEIKEEKKQHRYLINPGSSINYQIDSEIEQVFNLNENSQQRLVKINFQHPTYQFDPIESVDIDKIGVKGNIIRPKNKDQERSFTIFVEVVPKDTRKLLLISSEMIFYNLTKNTIEIRLFELSFQDHTNMIFERIYPNMAFSVPFDRTRQHMDFKFIDDPDYCKPISLALLSENKGRKIECPHSSKFTIIKCKTINQNQYLVYFQPPYQIKNCLPMDINFQIFGNKTDEQNTQIEIRNSEFYPQLKEKNQFENLILQDQGLLQKQETKQINLVSLKGRLALKIKPPQYQYNDMKLINLIRKDQQDKLFMSDYWGELGQVEIKRIKNTFYIYTELFAVNELPFQLFFYKTENRKQRQEAALFPGQSRKDKTIDIDSQRIVILGEQTALQISSYDKANSLSDQIQLNLTGNQKFKLEVDEGFMELGYNISLVTVDKALVTKVITVSPRFVILNQTDYLIEVVQDGHLEGTKILSKERMPFCWRSQNNDLIRIQLRNTQIQWKISNPIDPNQTGFSCFTLRSQQNLQITKHLNCVTRIDNQTIYLVILECKMPPRLESEIQQEQVIGQIDPPYVIVNNLENVKLVIYQVCCEEPQYIESFPLSEYKLIIESKTQTAFSWEYPNQTRELIVQFRFEGELNNQYSMEQQYFKFEESDAVREFVLNNQIQEQEQFRFYIVNVWEGSSRKLKFVQELYISQEDKSLMKLVVEISQIGISLIDSERNRRYELLYATFKGLGVKINQNTQMRTSQIEIKYINIDNNSSFTTMFPVIMTPTKFKEIFDYNRPHFSLIIEQSTQVNTVSVIKSIKAQLQNTTIRLTSQMLEQIYLVYKQISLQFISNIKIEEQTKQYDFEFSLQRHQKGGFEDISNTAIQNKVQLKYGIGSQQIVDELEWQTIQLIHTDRATYINRIEIYPLRLNLTLYITATRNLEYGVVFQILKTLGLMLCNIDEAPLQLDGINLQNSYDTSAGILAKLITHYKDMIVELIVKLVGSFEIFGNPVGLVKSLATGVYDLIDKPIEGFIKGPIEGGIGIGKGVGSLVKNTVSGTFNSTSKIAGSLGGACAYISFDDKFQQVREQFRVDKPREMIQGVVIGSQMLAISVKRGIVGVVDLPYQGYKDKKIKGGLTGVLLGSVGFFIKPIGGMFDFISKTSDGVKATALYWDDKANEKRERKIRPLYSVEKYYKSFSEKDANLIDFLCDINIKFSQIRYFDKFEFGSQDYQRALVLSIEMIIFVDVRKKKIIWTIDSNDINRISLTENGVEFILKTHNEKLKANFAIVDIASNEYLKKQIEARTQQLMKVLSGI